MKLYRNPFFILIVFVLCISLIDSCKKSSSISACIGTIPASASVSATVTFSSCTSGAGTYLWRFGDGDSSSGATVTHSYATAGNYTGTLMVTSGGSSSTKTFPINVFANNFSFRGITYNTDSVIASSAGATLAATVLNGTTTTTITCKFANLPTSSGSYAIISADSFPVGNQLYVILNNYSSTAGQTIYNSVSTSPAVNATVTVTAGKISVTVPTIEMHRFLTYSDSASLSAAIVQTQ